MPKTGEDLQSPERGRSLKTKLAIGLGAFATTAATAIGIHPFWGKDMLNAPIYLTVSRPTGWDTNPQRLIEIVGSYGNTIIYRQCQEDFFAPQLTETPPKGCVDWPVDFNNPMVISASDYQINDEVGMITTEENAGVP